MDHSTDGQGSAMKRALVVGGQHAFVKEKLSKSLARHGIEIAQHWGWEKSKPPAVWPKSLDLIYICTDMVSHKIANPAVEHCRNNSIPYVNGTRKWAESIIRLTSAGFPLVNPTESLADILDDHLKGLTPDMKKNGPSEAEMSAMVVAMAGSLEMAESMLDTATKHTLYPAIHAPLEPLMPSAATVAAVASEPAIVVKHRDPYAYARDPKQPLQAAYIREILRNPEVTNKQIEAALRAAGIAKGFDPIRGTSARQFCGVSMDGSGPGVRRKIDEEKFIAAAIELDFHDFNLPGSKKTEPTPAPEPEVKTRPPVNMTPPSNAEPPVKVPPMFDVRTLVSMLRTRMKEENFTELHITENGVQFKRVQVTEGTLDI